jgi:hypothetical protein
MKKKKSFHFGTSIAGMQLQTGAEHCGVTKRGMASVNVAVGNLVVGKHRHYISVMSQNYLCFIQLHC